MWVLYIQGINNAANIPRICGRHIMMSHWPAGGYKSVEAASLQHASYGFENIAQRDITL